MRPMWDNLISGTRKLGAVRAASLISWVALFAVGAILTGCRARNADESETDRAFAVALLHDVERLPNPEYKERAKAALTKLNDNAVDTKPVIFVATLTYGDPNVFLIIACIDEDRDLRGIRLREQYEDGNGAAATREEDYPVFPAFARGLKSPTVERRLIPVVIREDNKHKDELLWSQYENYVSNAVIRKAITGGRRDVPRASECQMTPMEMPPIYISFPDPNGIHIQASVDDRVGHTSEWIEVHAAATMTLLQKKDKRGNPGVSP